MKKNLLTLLLIGLAYISQAQSVTDAFMFSSSNYQGTAKSLAMGSAIGAVGADFTCLAINPAGMGLFRSTDISITTDLALDLATTSCYGNQEKVIRPNFSIDNFGYVQTWKPKKQSGLRHFQVGIGYNRINDFNNRAYAKGINNKNSMIDMYANEAQGLSEEELRTYYPMDIYQAWETYLLDTMNGSYISRVPTGDLLQAHNIYSYGKITEWTVAFSGNLWDRVFFGVSIGLPYIKNHILKDYREEVVHPSEDSDLEKWAYDDYLHRKGGGSNIKLGAIVFPMSWLRLGVAYHSRTVYELDETWITSTESFFAGNHKYSKDGETEYFYEFSTPRRFIASAAVLFGRDGMISVDAEWLNYGIAFFNDIQYDYSSLNEEIAQSYTSTMNIRVGADYKINGCYLRGGFVYNGSPYGLQETDKRFMSASVGAGIPVSGAFIIDLAYAYNFMRDQYYMYNYYDVQPITLKRHGSNISATFRLKL